MKVYEYKDYDEYVEIQTEANKEKLGWFFVTPRVIKAILEDNPMVGSVLCHGTRGGAEQYEFQKYLPHAYVVGTEISEHCRDVPMTVQWDMQVPKEEINRFKTRQLCRNLSFLSRRIKAICDGPTYC